MTPTHIVFKVPFLVPEGGIVRPSANHFRRPIDVFFVFSVTRGRSDLAKRRSQVASTMFNERVAANRLGSFILDGTPKTMLTTWIVFEYLVLIKYVGRFDLCISRADFRDKI